MQEKREFACCCCYPDCWNDEGYNNNSREKNEKHKNCWCDEDNWKEDDCKEYNYENSREYENEYSKNSTNNSKCNCNNNNKDEDIDKKPTRRNRCCFCNLFRFHC